MADPEQIESGTETPPEVPPEVQTPAPEQNGEPPKKRRGRPPGSGKRSAEQIEAGTAAGKTAEKPSKRKAEKMDASQIAQMGKQLAGLHAVASIATGIPELAISEQEGMMLAASVAAVCEEYGLSLTGKTGAAIQLFGTCGIIYVPRLLSVQKRAAQAAQARKQQDENRTVDSGIVPTH